MTENSKLVVVCKMTFAAKMRIEKNSNFITHFEIDIQTNTNLIITRLLCSLTLAFFRKASGHFIGPHHHRTAFKQISIAAVAVVSFH